MKNLINIISKAIDCPLMDTHNISFEIADYLVHRIFYLQHEGESREWRSIITKGCFLATNEEEAWKLYEKHSKNIPFAFRVEKGDFMENLSYDNRSYLTTDGASIRHFKVEWYDEVDDFHMVEYEYKHPTKKVIRKKISQRARQHNIWFLPMIDVMMDGAEYNPVTILRR
jgi:hypothetical protein